MAVPSGTVILWDNSVIPAGWELLYSPSTPICIRAHGPGVVVENYVINNGASHTHEISPSSVASHTHTVNDASPITISSAWSGNDVSIGNVANMASSNHSHELTPEISEESHSHGIGGALADASANDVVPTYYTYRLIVKT